LMAEVQQLNEELERRVRDRTARLKRAYEDLRGSREELRALSAHMEQIREGERTRIAREIHDELGQALTGLKMDLSGLEPAVGATASEAIAARVPAAIDGMIATVQRIATELRPQILDDVGLVAALEWHARDFEKRTGVKCRVRCRGTAASVDVSRSTALFRIFQEILTNVIRHAGASRVFITLTIGLSSVRLDVRDNGKGMSGRPAMPGKHLGLLGMQERAGAFGGVVRFSTAPSKGTTVRVSIPLARRALKGRP
jgi:signal transduction histidine kinase